MKNEVTNPIIQQLLAWTEGGLLKWKSLGSYLEENDNEKLVDLLIANDPYKQGETGSEFNRDWLKRSLCASEGETACFLLMDPSGNWDLCVQQEEDGIKGDIETVDVPKMELMSLLMAALEQIKEEALEEKNAQ